MCAPASYPLKLNQLISRPMSDTYTNTFAPVMPVPLSVDFHTNAFVEWTGIAAASVATMMNVEQTWNRTAARRC
jgi:hypothetical protein